MGEVLRFPNTIRNAGDLMTSVPWDLTWMQSGMADLRHRLEEHGGTDTTHTQGIKKRIREVEEKHQKLTAQLQQFEAAKQWDQVAETSERLLEVTRELNTLRQEVDQYELRIANALWGEQTYPFRPAFVETVQKAYGAKAASVDFLHHWEEARVGINRWVEEETRDRIKNLLGQGTVTQDTRLVLTNAIYFKGRWANEFDKQHTQEADFTGVDGKTVKTNLMAARNLEAPYAELLLDGTRRDPLPDQHTQEDQAKPNLDGFQILELPYRGDELTMVILLPKRSDGLPALEEKLTADTLATWQETMRRQKVHVFLPKFTLETSYPLKETLAAMGMPAAFEPGGFTGISDVPEARSLAISAVLHKAFVDVNEEGTEAAAATAVVVGVRSARIEPPTPTFRADHPFLFLIRDRQSGSILFVGRVMNPS